MQKKLYYVLFAALLISGCIQSEQEYSLNPDGSGKVVYKIEYPVLSFGEESTPEDKAKSAVRELLEESSGIEAWKDIRYELLSGDRLAFEGTAYFPDFNALELHNGELGDYKPSFAVDEEDQRVLRIASEPEAGKSEEPPELSEQDLDAAVTEMQTEYKTARGMLTGILTGMRIDQRYHLPGDAIDISNFQRADKGAYQLTFEGEALLALMDELMGNAELLREQLKQGRNPLKDQPMRDKELNQRLFGEKGPLKIVLDNAAEALFDYQAEVQVASTEFIEFQKSLDIVPLAVPDPAGDSGFSEIIVGGIKLVRASHLDAFVRPFSDEPSYSLALIGRFPGSVVDVENGELLQAIADNGEDLLPERDFSRRIHSPDLSDDKTEVGFEVSMKLPSSDVRGLKMVSGVLEYTIAQGAETFDLGIQKFEQGASGTSFDASITGLEPNPYGDGTVLLLSLKLSGDQVIAVQFFDDNGQLIETRRQSYMSSGGTTELEFVAEPGFPASGSIKVEKHSDLQKHRARFEISNIDLLGRPM